MHKCTSTIISMYICTVTITCAFNILVFFDSIGSVREREVVSEEIIKNCKIMNMLLNRCIE